MTTVETTEERRMAVLERERGLYPMPLAGGAVRPLAVVTREVVHAARRLIGGRPPRAEWLRAVL